MSRDIIGQLEHGTEWQMQLDTLSWPTHQSPREPTYIISQSLTVQAI